jgi:hypothetical protein
MNGNPLRSREMLNRREERDRHITGSPQYQNYILEQSRHEEIIKALHAIADRLRAIIEEHDA